MHRHQDAPDHKQVGGGYHLFESHQYLLPEHINRRRYYPRTPRTFNLHHVLFTGSKRDAFAFYPDIYAAFDKRPQNNGQLHEWNSDECPFLDNGYYPHLPFPCNGNYLPDVKETKILFHKKIYGIC